MVVTRRTPVLPPQQSSARNHSAQGAQRPSRSALSSEAMSVSKNAGTSVALAVPSGENKDHSNGLDTNNSGKRSKRSRRHQKSKYQKSNFQAFLDFLTKLLLLGFTIYMFSVCPQDAHLQSPICRGLAEYKRIVLDPYVIPPIQAALAHPSISPHLERAKPYIHRAAEIATPILIRTHQVWNLHVVPQWERRIMPEWNRRVISQWNKYVVPQWDKYAAPQVQLLRSTLEPYRLRVKQRYQHRVAPHVHVAIHNLQRWQRQAEPYVLLAVSRTKDGYHATKPYAAPLIKRCGHLIQRLALFLREQRQTFVDPHVAKMWEKVKELSRGRQVAHEATPERELSSSNTLFTVMDTLGYETIVSPTGTFPSAYHAISIPETTDVAPTSSSLVAGEMTDMESIFTPILESTASVQSVTDVESFRSTEAVPIESLPEPERPTPSAFTMEAATATSSALVAATATTSLDVPAPADEPTAPAPSPSKIPVPAASATVPPANWGTSDEIDFDAFFAELGLDDPLGNLGSEGDGSIPPSPPRETEEEKTERLRLKAEETAQKRADIWARQAKWEAELHTQMEHSTSQLQIRLGQLRVAAAAELSTSAEIRSSIEELVNEAEKYLKGAEIYLKNLKGESQKVDEKLALWDRVVKRVGEKFGERLMTTEADINTWFKIVLDKELHEVATATAEVRDVAEKGQLDLGLDYAWLEDVTYDDWQRYHALVGLSEQYAHEAAAIQNGTHPKVVVINPMSPVLEDLESEVQDVVIGFETRLRRIRRDGERAFSNHGNGNSQKEEEKGSSTEPEMEPEVSILPVPREGVREGGQGFIPPIMIGRSQAEVLGALDKVEPVNEAKRKVSRSHVDPEEAVSRLVREVSMEGGGGIDHTEL